MGDAPVSSYRPIKGLLINADHLAALHQAGLDSFDALMAAPGDVDLHKPSLARWRQRLALRVGDATMYLKRYDRPPLREQCAQRLRGIGATAAAEWSWLNLLWRAGIAAPRPVAFGVRYRGPWLEHQSLLLLEQVPGCSLESWMTDHPDGGGRQFKRSLAAALAQLVGKLHGHGLIHRDLYLAHVFIDQPQARPVELTLIDLQRMLRPRLRWRRWLVKDLAALNHSTPPGAAATTDRVRWYRHYRRIGRLAPSDKSLIRAIVTKTRRIGQHSRRHGLG